MKTINVAIMIQLDIDGDNPVGEVCEALDKINTILFNEGLDSQPEIFVSGINSSDILEVDIED